MVAAPKLKPIPNPQIKTLDKFSELFAYASQIVRGIVAAPVFPYLSILIGTKAGSALILLVIFESIRHKFATNLQKSTF